MGQVTVIARGRLAIFVAAALDTLVVTQEHPRACFGWRHTTEGQPTDAEYRVLLESIGKKPLFKKITFLFDDSFPWTFFDHGLHQSTWAVRKGRPQPPNVGCECLSGLSHGCWKFLCFALRR